jgi:hypothetical protein
MKFLMEYWGMVINQINLFDLDQMELWFSCAYKLVLMHPQALWYTQFWVQGNQRKVKELGHVLWFVAFRG